MINKWPKSQNERDQTLSPTGPSPNPSPAGRGVITEIPLTSCCSLLVVLFAVVSHVFLHSLSPYFICLNTSVQYVHSVYLCLSVILSISINFPFSMYILSVSVTYMKSGGCRLR